MFVRGGVAWPDDDLDGAGGDGLYWSSVGRNSSIAYGLYFRSGRVYPSYDYGARYVGFSLRRVALGG